jgi:3'-phosphoadenosine 5'-phosphosulfate sulfotransferase (PAPS reductase)/FAD synthetase
MMAAEHIISVSGGKDSTATYCLAVERGRPFRAVAADTGNEHPATYEAVNRLAERTGGPVVEWVKADFSRQITGKRKFIAEHWEADGVPADLVARALEILQPTGNPFLDLCLWKGRFPSRKAQFCTQELKVEPIDQQVTRPRLALGKRVISWQGVRAAESIERRFLPPFQRLANHEDLPGRLYVYRPLLKVESVQEVFAIAVRHAAYRQIRFMAGACGGSAAFRASTVPRPSSRWLIGISQSRSTGLRLGRH